MKDEQVKKAVDQLLGEHKETKKIKENIDDEFEKAFSSKDFMQPEIVEGDWYEVDGDEGIIFIPIDVVGTLSEVEDYLNDDTESFELFDAAKQAVQDYYGVSRIYSIEKRYGFGVRLSAPGYMDQTDWSVYDTEEEAKSELIDMYGSEYYED